MEATQQACKHCKLSWKKKEKNKKTFKSYLLLVHVILIAYKEEVYVSL